MEGSKGREGKNEGEMNGRVKGKRGNILYGKEGWKEGCYCVVMEGRREDREM